MHISVPLAVFVVGKVSENIVPQTLERIKIFFLAGKFMAKPISNHSLALRPPDVHIPFKRLGRVSENIAKYYDIPQGLYVSYVTKGSDAEAKGIKRGDIITRVNGRDAFANSDVADAKEGLKAGDELTFTIWRDGKTTEITVKLMDPADMK